MEEISLRPFEDADLPLFREWLSREHVAKWYGDAQDWLDEVAGRRDAFCWLHHFIVTHAGKDIGFCQYYPYERSGEEWHGALPREGTYSIDYLIGEPEALKKGFGRAIVRLLTERIRATADARRIIVQPEEENLPSCNTLLSAGYTYDGEDRLYLLNL